MKTFLATAIAVLGITATSYAAEKCNVAAAEWQPREALQAKLEKEGWKVRSIKTEDGCYEAYAINAKGQKVEAYFDPKSFAAVDVKIED